MEVEGVKVEHITLGEWQAQLNAMANSKPKQQGPKRLSAPTMFPYGNDITDKEK